MASRPLYNGIAANCKHNIDFSVVKASRPVQKGKVRDPNFDPSYATFYICACLHVQLAAMSKSRGRLLKFGEDSGLATYWENYARYLAEVVGIVNRCIQADAGKGDLKAFSYMYTLISSSMLLDSTLWIAHVNGAFAFAQHLGGIEAITKTSMKPYTSFIRLVS